jgi:hypothetical protein
MCHEKRWIGWRTDGRIDNGTGIHTWREERERTIQI